MDVVAKLLLPPVCPANVQHWKLLGYASTAYERNPVPEVDEPVFYPGTFEMDAKKLYDRNPVQKHCDIVRQQLFFVRIGEKKEGMPVQG